MGSFLFMGLIGVVIAAGEPLCRLHCPSVRDFGHRRARIGLDRLRHEQLKGAVRGRPRLGEHSKLAVWGALSLYLNFINIFQLLLSLTGERE